MSGLVEKVKNKLHIGSGGEGATTETPPGSDPHAKNITQQATGGPGTNQTHNGVHPTSGTGQHTTGQTTTHHVGRGRHPTCTQDHEHTMACGLGAQEHGKQDAWSHAHSKTQEASKEANASELAACKAQEHYASVTEAQKHAENARRRQNELEAELERLRGQGVDLTGHQQKLEEHKRHLADLENRHARALQAAKERDHDAALREREAGKLQDQYTRKQQGLSPLEAELENLRRERESAHSNHQTLQAEYNEYLKKHQARKGNIERLNNELLTDGNRVKELEAELSAAKDRVHKRTTHLTSLKNDHEAYERDLPNLQKRLDHASSRINLLKEKEAELMRQYEAHQEDIHKHRGLVSDAQRGAEAERARAEDARRRAEGLPEEMDMHKQGLTQAQRDAAEAQRRQREIDLQSHKLGDHLDKARARADQAETTTTKHTDNLQQARREAEMHAERKEHAWSEAQAAGQGGSSMEGSHLSHLKDKIKHMAPGHHSSTISTTTHHSPEP